MNSKLENASSKIPDAANPARPSDAGIQQMRAKFMLDLMSIDQARAQSLFQCWNNWEEQARGQSDMQLVEFQTMAQYIPHRLKDIGQGYASKRFISQTMFLIAYADE